MSPNELKISFTDPLKKENEFLTSFLKMYFNSHEIAVTAISETEKGRTPDYLIRDKGILIEVKTIHDKESLEESARWQSQVNALQNYIDTEVHSKEIKGLYLINTPPAFIMPRTSKALRDAASLIIAAVQANKSKLEIFGVIFEIERIGDEENGIHFGNMSSAFLNPAQIIHRNILRNLIKGNDQLSYRPDNVKVDKRILLLVNKYFFGDKIHEVIEALSYAYGQLLQLSNIDEIWLQREEGNGYKNTLILTKSFLERYDTGQLQASEQNNHLFQLWFSSLERLSDSHKGKLFANFKHLVANKRPEDIFSDHFARQEMVRLGNWLAEKERWGDVNYLISKFLNDSDPPELDPYHHQIINGNDPSIITTVLGHLAWVIQRLGQNRSNILNTLEYTLTLLKHKNLYIKLQAIIPLTALAARREWLLEIDKETRGNNYRKLHDAIFTLLTEQSEHLVIAKWLTNVFNYFKELTTDEVILALENLKKARESAPLFIYFALFRERHFVDRDIPYDSTKIKAMLTETITSTDPSNQALKANLSWNFWKLLDDNPEEFETVKPYISLFFQQPLDQTYHSNLIRIIEESISEHFTISYQWLTLYLEQVRKYAQENETARYDIWLSLKKIVETIRDTRPQLLEKIKTSLDQISDTGIRVFYDE